MNVAIVCAPFRVGGSGNAGCERIGATKALANILSGCAGDRANYVVQGLVGRQAYRHRIRGEKPFRFLLRNPRAFLAERGSQHRVSWNGDIGGLHSVGLHGGEREFVFGARAGSAH